MVGTVFGLVCVAVALSLVVVGCWLTLGAWGLFVAAGVWLACGVLLIRPEVLFDARTA